MPHPSHTKLHSINFPPHSINTFFFFHSPGTRQSHHICSQLSLPQILFLSSYNINTFILLHLFERRPLSEALERLWNKFQPYIHSSWQWSLLTVFHLLFLFYSQPASFDKATNSTSSSNHHDGFHRLDHSTSKVACWGQDFNWLTWAVLTLTPVSLSTSSTVTGFKNWPINNGRDHRSSNFADLLSFFELKGWSLTITVCPFRYWCSLLSWLYLFATVSLRFLRFRTASSHSFSKSR